MRPTSLASGSLWQTRVMLERVWLAAILVFIGGWTVVWLSPGSVTGGLAVYAGTAALLLLAVVALGRFALGRRSRA